MNDSVDRHAWYANSLQLLEQDLHSNTVFPVKVWLGNRQHQFRIWQGEQLPDRLLAIDTETAKIEAREIPQLALAAVCGSEGAQYFIHPDRLPQFIRQHAGAYWCCHNACFDFWVTAQHLQTDPAALAVWWDTAGAGRLCCTMILDALIQLARIDAEPRWRDLGTVASEYCGLPLNKDDPYRLRYAELIGLAESDWSNTEPGFWTYACKDPIATLQVCQEQIRISQQLIDPHRGELLPDALRRFGPLTACLQVQGATPAELKRNPDVPVIVERLAKWNDGKGRKRKGLVNASGDRVSVETGSYLISYYDADGKRQEVNSGTPDRDAAQQIAAKLETEVSLRKRGIIDSTQERLAKEGQRTINEHVGDFRAYLAAKDNTPNHVNQTYRQIKRIVSDCHAQRITDLTGSAVLGTIGKLRDGGTSLRTCNSYLRSIKSFTRWLWIEKRTPDDALAGLSQYNEATDRRHVRRELTPDELAYLLDHVECNPKQNYCLSGPVRAMAYRVALGTGFRKELRTLTPASFDLDAEAMPTLTPDTPQQAELATGTDGLAEISMPANRQQSGGETVQNAANTGETPPPRNTDADCPKVLALNTLGDNRRDTAKWSGAELNCRHTDFQSAALVLLRID